jgi:endogenous inhibitor of DNA gyrase (YacG/DUF329 family)
MSAELVTVHCLYCGKAYTVPQSSAVGMGMLLPFCSDDDCEDRYAAK